jgi:hypothetical protein
MELRRWKMVRSKTIIKLITYFIFIYFFSLLFLVDQMNMNRYILVLEYADNGTLDTEHFNELNWNDKLGLALNLANAVSYLHNYDIIHQNLVMFQFNFTN